MIRLFDQHIVRRQRELEGIWRFVREDGSTYDLPVPGCWEQHPDLLTYRGKGTYYRKVFVREQSNVRLEFKGVSHTADVYFDEEHLVHHYNAFTPFCGIAKDVAPGEHTIRVEVDNSFGEHSALHIPNDYYTYGGITRPVSMEELGALYIRNVHFLPILKDGRWSAKVVVWVENLGKTQEEAEVICTLRDAGGADGSFVQSCLGQSCRPSG